MEHQLVTSDLFNKTFKPTSPSQDNAQIYLSITRYGWRLNTLMFHQIKVLQF